MLDVSPATIRNWARTGYLTPKRNQSPTTKLTFTIRDILKVQKEIGNGNSGKLHHRANKRNSAQIFIPGEYVQDQQTLDALNRIISLYRQDTLTVDGIIILTTIELLETCRLLKKTGARFPENLVFAHQSLRREMLNWFQDAGIQTLTEHRQLTEGLQHFHRAVSPLCDDFPGLLYQSLKTEGQKSRQGSYYTPAKIVNDMVQEILEPDHLALDPCCGTGQFLLSIAKQCRDPHKIWGFDTDTTAARIARINLMAAFPQISFSPNVYTLNSLTDIEDRVFSGLNIPQFDVVISNPPWGMHFSPDETELLHRLYPDISSGESFSYFIAKGADLLKPGGTLSFLLPGSVLNIGIHRDIRKKILEELTITQVHSLGRVFSNVFTPVIRMDLKKQQAEHTSFPLKRGDISCEQSVLQNTRDFRLTIFRDKIGRDLLNKIFSARHNTLFNNADWALGIVTGNNAKYLKSEQATGLEPILTGKEIRRFLPAAARKFIAFEPHNFQQVAPEHIYRSGEKLLYRFISRQLVFACDSRQTLTLNSANILIPRIPGYPIKTILALFNSSLYQFIYQTEFATLKVLRSVIEALPLPLCTPAVHEEINALVDELMKPNIPASDRLLLYRHMDTYIMKLFALRTGEQRQILESVNNPTALLETD